MNDSSQSRIELLKQYIADDSGDIFSQYALALEYIKQGNNAEAITLLSNIAAHYPNYLAVYYQLGKLFEQRGLITEAKEIYEKGIAVAQQHKELKTLNELRAALDSLEE